MRTPSIVVCAARLQCLADHARAWLVATAVLASPCPEAIAQLGASWNSVGPPGGTVLSMLKSPRSESLLYAGT